MWCYRKAKAAELTLLLQWLRKELEDLSKTRPNQATSIGHLLAEFAKVDQSFRLVMYCFSVNDLFERTG